jgi:hypothetical protein
MKGQITPVNNRPESGKKMDPQEEATGERTLAEMT